MIMTITSATRWMDGPQTPPAQSLDIIKWCGVVHGLQSPRSIQMLCALLIGTDKFQITGATLLVSAAPNRLDNNSQ